MLRWAGLTESTATPATEATPAAEATPATDATPAVALPEAERVVLDYCAAVRGVLNDDQGGPLQPPGLRMAEALTEVRASIQRNLDAKKGGALPSLCRNSPAVSTEACKQ
jgi:hypothetical protein